MTQVVNIHRREEFDVYIGRAGKGQDGYFGNPIPLGDSREDCLTAYRAYFYKRIEEDAEFAKRVADLKGKRLGCFCVPKICHGMVIVEYLEGFPVAEQMSLLSQRELLRKLSTAPRSIFDD